MEHPIQGLMKTAMESLSGMIDVNTVICDSVESQDGTVIIPVSRVSLGYVAGGGEYSLGLREIIRTSEQNGSGQWPFGGGSGAGLSVSPVGFLVVGKQNVRFLPVDQRASIERIIDVAPELVQKFQDLLKKKGNGNAAREDAAHAVNQAVRHSDYDDLDDYDDI